MTLLCMAGEPTLEIVSVVVIVPSKSKMRMGGIMWGDWSLRMRTTVNIFETLWLCECIGRMDEIGFY